MKTNIILFGLIVFIISLIITLNIFFQQSYQSEMAEQFNRQQLIIAKSIATSIEDDIQHIESETLSLARLLAARRLDDKNIEEYVSAAYSEVREEISANIKVLDSNGRLVYSSLGESLKSRDTELFLEMNQSAAGKVRYLDLLATDRRIIMTAPVEGPQGLKGVLIVEVMIDTINKKFLTPIRAGIRGHAWMMDGNGVLLYHPTQPKMVGKNLNKADESCYKCHTSFDAEKKILESGDIGFSSYIAPYGEDKLLAFSSAKIADMSWFVCVSIPYSEVTFSIRRSMKLHSLLVISIFIATVTAAFALVRINRQRVKAEEKTRHLEMQRHLEKEILQTKDYLENILESTESKIMVLDCEMQVKTINSAHERLCNQNKDDVVGRSFFDVFPIATDEDREMIKGILEKCLEGSSHRISNYSYIRGSKPIYLNISINPLILHGEVSGLILSSSDVTEEVTLKEVLRNYAARLEELVKERTDELLSEKEKLNAIVETLEAGLFLVSESKQITWVNRTLREWIGKDSIQDITLDKIYGGNDLQRAIVNNRMIQEVIYHDFGRRKGYFQVTSTPLVGPDGHVQTLVLIQDITDMKRMEEQMMHSEKLSALARISAGVAHEIGNPLTSISSYVQILREMEHDEFTRESLDTIAKHINRIADIVRQMSSFSRTATSDLKPHDVSEIVALTLDLVKYDKRLKNIKINLDIPNTLPGVFVNETQSIQVFMNIILNAADAMSSGGTLDIKAERLERDVEISFSDTGHGISAEHLEKIFDPFFTTKEKGTGLGLAVSYNIIKSYQGDIVVENKPDGGTIFKVRLPYHEI
ncbi:MAG: ATP-binding protein [Nitrospirota bacterium]|nr:ATP-binding protein [Nitrospirota bacterium]